MKVLNEIEVGMVIGGADVCIYEEHFDGIVRQITEEVGNFFACLNQLGSDLGIWFYNYTHGC